MICGEPTIAGLLMAANCKLTYLLVRSLPRRQLRRSTPKIIILGRMQELAGGSSYPGVSWLALSLAVEALSFHSLSKLEFGQLLRRMTLPLDGPWSSNEFTTLNRIWWVWPSLENISFLYMSKVIGKIIETYQVGEISLALVWIFNINSPTYYNFS